MGIWILIGSIIFGVILSKAVKRQGEVLSEAIVQSKNDEPEKNLVETRRAEVGKCDAVSNRFGDVYGWDLFKNN